MRAAETDTKKHDAQEAAEIVRTNAHGADTKAHENAPTGQVFGQVLSPRASLIGALTTAVRDAAQSGDLGAARIAYEALGRLLSDPATPGEVVDLSTERDKRR